MKLGKIIGLESLRGICAILVALGHILHWSQTQEFENWLIYGVCVFFVISGAVLYINYNNLNRLDDFFVKRFARLSPLYIFTLIITYVGHKWAVGWEVVFNVPMLFGLFSNRCAVTGCWSLGVEFLLYLLFPTLLAFTKTGKSCLATFALLLGLRVAGIEDVSGKDWWEFYINPGNFAVLFFGGMLIAKYATLISWPRYVWIFISIFCFAILFGYSTSNHYVFGIIGLTYTLACILLVLSFWNIDLPFSGILGQISYGVYLLHPIVWGFLHAILAVPVWICLIVTIPITGVLSWAMLNYYEMPVRRRILAIWDSKCLRQRPAM